jgi:E3 ubiquitin-protein ligase RNF115/126
MRQVRIAAAPTDDDDGDDDDDNESDHAHEREMAGFSRYFTRNSQVSGMSLRDFINDHFNGVSSPPTRSIIWFNITTPNNNGASSSYVANLRLAEQMGGRVEVGLTDHQLKDCTFTSSNLEELAISGDDICPICHENLMETTKNNTPVCILACGHIYCDECIKTWLSRHKTCPVCKVDLEDAYCWGR